MQDESGVLCNVNRQSKRNRVATVMLQAISYLSRLFSHLSFVLIPEYPHYEIVNKSLRGRSKIIYDMELSVKLLRVKNIQYESGIGSNDMNGSESGGHRVLIFVQLKQMLDLV